MMENLPAPTLPAEVPILLDAEPFDLVPATRVRLQPMKLVGFGGLTVPMVSLVATHLGEGVSVMKHMGTFGDN